METEITLQTNPECKDNGGSDESCILIDKNISTIEILDDTIEDANETLAENVADSMKVINTSIEEYEVIDEVADESEGGSQEESRADCNGSLTNNHSEQNDQLNVTPISEPSKVLIDIKFTNRKTYLAFQEEFVTIVKNYYKAKIDDLNILDDMSSNRICVSEKIVKKSDAFLVDKTPNLKNLKESRDESTPQYRKSFGKSVLTDEKAEEEKVATPSRGACFNCDKSTHSIRDCPEPRNMRKINKARNEFSKNNSNVRYHEDAENDRAMVPGKISESLRAALGINAHQIPTHVYKMRLFGYPPGWLEEAKVHNSGLSLFVEKDKKQLHPGADEGETETSDFKYDIQKIYDFPGFNVNNPDPKFHDQHHLFNVPPMIPQHSKEEMIRIIGEDKVVNGYKRIKLRESGTIVDLAESEEFLTDKTSVTVTDMEIEDQASETIPLGVTVYLAPALPSESISKPPEPMEDGELSNDSTARSKSPNESELIEQRKALMAEIAESSVFLETSSVNTSLDITAPTPSNQSRLNETIIENSENENRDNSAKETSPELRPGHVDSTIEGCPVLPSFSPFSNLPDGEKFQEGVCDVIAFENLAESTGKYEKMKTLIKKVRVFQKHHQVE